MRWLLVFLLAGCTASAPAHDDATTADPGVEGAVTAASSTPPAPTTDASTATTTPPVVAPSPPPVVPPPPPLGPDTHVVVATFDTGTNPFHPCFRREGWDASKAGIPGFPADAVRLELAFRETYDASLAASQPALSAMKHDRVHYVPGTNVLFYGLPDEFIDYFPHGSQASSQIGCTDYGMAEEAWIVVLNWYLHPERNEQLMDWVAQQAWIDVVHFNIQDTPWPLTTSETRGLQAVADSGAFVVIAAGNGVAGAGASYPMELSSRNSPSQALIAGANDNGGYAYYSNLDPHVVMDGMGTVAAEPYGMGETSFSGTSSASPRVTGYVAELLRQARAAAGHTGVREGDVLVRGEALPGGSLTVAQVHEAVRKTADPNPHASRYDGSASLGGVPQPVDLPFAFYPKMGYGEVSEHTLPHALAVLLGTEPMPERPMEDEFYQASQDVREAWWG